MVQKRFYEDYPPHPEEKKYNYKCSSTMKPTQVQVTRVPFKTEAFLLERVACPLFCCPVSVYHTLVVMLLYHRVIERCSTCMYILRTKGGFPLVFSYFVVFWRVPQRTFY